MVTVKRIPFGNDHDDAKWIVLEGSVEGEPACTKRVTINVAALADGRLTLAGEKQRLIDTVNEYHARVLAAREALKEIE